MYYVYQDNRCAGVGCDHYVIHFERKSDRDFYVEQKKGAGSPGHTITAVDAKRAKSLRRKDTALYGGVWVLSGHKFRRVA